MKSEPKSVIYTLLPMPENGCEVDTVTLLVAIGCIEN